MAQPGQFALDPSVPPPGILAGQAQHQLPERGHSRGSAGTAAAGGVVPLLGDQLAVPGQHGAGGDGEDAGPAAPRYQRGQRGEPEPVGRLVADRALELTAQDSVLMPQHQQLGVLGSVPAQQDSRYDSIVRAARYNSDTIIRTGSQPPPTSTDIAAHLQRWLYEPHTGDGSVPTDSVESHAVVRWEVRGGEDVPDALARSASRSEGSGTGLVTRRAATG